MKITAVTRLKWGALFDALLRAKWTGAELSRRTGLHPTRVSEYLTMKRRPTEEDFKKIEEAFIKAGIDVDLLESWPEKFIGFGTTRKMTLVQTQDIEVELLMLQGEQPTPLQLAESIDDGEILREEVKALPPRLQTVINLRFGLEGEEEHGLKQIGEKLGVSRERVRQMEARALRILRHPEHSRRLRGKSYKTIKKEVTPRRCENCKHFEWNYMNPPSRCKLTGEVAEKFRGCFSFKGYHNEE